MTTGTLSKKMEAKTLMILASRGALCGRVASLIATNLSLCSANLLLPHRDREHGYILARLGPARAATPLVSALLMVRRLPPLLTANGADAQRDSTFGRVHISSFVRSPLFPSRQVQCQSIAHLEEERTTRIRKLPIVAASDAPLGTIPTYK